jgi:hypothetical protein
MRKIAVAFLALSALALSGCASMHQYSPPAPMRVNVQANVKSDIAVGRKISGQASVTKILFFTLGSDSNYEDGVVYAGAGTRSAIPLLGGNGAISKAKAAAAYKAIHNSGADLIVAPQYVIHTKDYTIFKTITAKVTGYAGHIKSIK